LRCAAFHRLPGEASTCHGFLASPFPPNNGDIVPPKPTHHYVQSLSPLAATCGGLQRGIGMVSSGSTFEGSTLVGQTIVLDGNTYIRCVFKQCTLIYKATAPVTLSGCTFDSCGFALDGNAALTVSFLSGIYANGGQGIVNDIIDQIRGRKTH
jgi:hypothetical protein